jgi:hypothetical protein
MISEFAFVPRNKSFNQLQIWPSVRINNFEFGEMCANCLDNQRHSEREIEIFTEHPRLG